VEEKQKRDASPSTIVTNFVKFDRNDQRRGEERRGGVRVNFYPWEIENSELVTKGIFG
jgi:hypothetical protein